MLLFYHTERIASFESIVHKKGMPLSNDILILVEYMNLNNTF